MNCDLPHQNILVWKRLEEVKFSHHLLVSNITKKSTAISTTFFWHHLQLRRFGWPKVKAEGQSMGQRACFRGKTRDAEVQLVSFCCWQHWLQLSHFWIVKVSILWHSQLPNVSKSTWTCTEVQTSCRRMTVLKVKSHISILDQKSLKVSHMKSSFLVQNVLK